MQNKTCMWSTVVKFPFFSVSQQGEQQGHTTQIFWNKLTPVTTVVQIVIAVGQESPSYYPAP